MEATTTIDWTAVGETMKTASAMITQAGRPASFRHDRSGLWISFDAGDGHFLQFFALDADDDPSLNLGGRPVGLYGCHVTEWGDFNGDVPTSYADGVDFGDPVDVASAILASIDCYKLDPYRERRRVEMRTAVLGMDPKGRSV